MSASLLTLRGRRRAEALMLDACTITRRAAPVYPDTTTDGDTGKVTPSVTTIYTGPCKIQAADAAGSPTRVGEAELVTSSLTLHLPMSATGVTADDIAAVTASLLDPDLAGKVFTIRAPDHKSFKTARRFPLQELSS